jgi:hypothetical protein
MGKVKMKHRYVALHDALDQIVVLDNKEYGRVELTEVPLFLAERIALLKLCDINRSNKGGLLGRKLTDHHVVVYLSYDEFVEILKLNGVDHG